MNDPERELAVAMGAHPEMHEVFKRRAIRMIFKTKADPDDERRFNEWRKSQGLESLDENNE